MTLCLGLLGCVGSPSAPSALETAAEKPSRATYTVEREELDQAGGITLGDALRRTPFGIHVRPGG